MAGRGMKFADWLEEKHPKFLSLSDSVELIITRLLKDAGIPFLAVTKRTKSISDCITKSRRKKYKQPSEQMTDISGVRVIVYFDHDVGQVCRLIEENFAIDLENSSNRDEALSVNQMGYRSVHYVCQLGADRELLREYQALANLKFEFQVRTVLQHAWAELAHDRNYKFSGKLPKEMERKLFLLAGLMETADNGFGTLSREIDEYVASVSTSAEEGQLDEIEVNALSLEEFVKSWGAKVGVKIEDIPDRSSYTDLLKELRQFNVRTLNDLQKIIPPDYSEFYRSGSLTVFGAVRDWMIISDPYRFIKDVHVTWVLTEGEMEVFRKYLSEDQLAALREVLVIISNEAVYSDDGEGAY
jgi:ppGpp synthetase/RelA/SpoT-type nucleotidyltranferase